MKYRTMMAVTAVSSLAILGACGSSGSNGGSGPVDTGPNGGSGPVDNRSFEDLAQEGEGLIGRLGEMDSTTTMPMTGSATYNGVAAFADEPDLADPGTLSAVRVTANFEDESISGAFYNFVDEHEERIPGEVAISNGEISGNTLAADLSGVLTMAGDPAQIDGRMTGVFLGAEAEAVSGGITASADDMPVYGIFGAER